MSSHQVVEGWRTKGDREKLRKKKMVGKIGKHAEELHHLQSRLATCEFHLWISYSTDNEHCTNALSLSHTLFRSHSVAVGRLKGLMSRIGVWIAFSARLHCCLHLQQSKLKLCSRFWVFFPLRSLSRSGSNNTNVSVLRVSELLFNFSCYFCPGDLSMRERKFIVAF